MRYLPRYRLSCVRLPAATRRCTTARAPRRHPARGRPSRGPHPKRRLATPHFLRSIPPARTRSLPPWRRPARLAATGTCTPGSDSGASRFSWHAVAGSTCGRSSGARALPSTYTAAAPAVKRGGAWDISAERHPAKAGYSPARRQTYSGNSSSTACSTLAAWSKTSPRSPALTGLGPRWPPARSLSPRITSSGFSLAQQTCA